MTKTAPSCRCGSWYRDNELERVSGTHWTALARLTREFHPLRVSQVALFACDGSRPLWTASTLGLRLDNRISPICGSSPPGPPRPVCARMAALPIPPFSKWGHGLLIPARLSSRTHIGRTQWTYSITGLSPARTGPPEGRRACADWRRCRKSPHFVGTFRSGPLEGRAGLCRLRLVSKLPSF